MKENQYATSSPYEVVAASSGNHGQALARAAHDLGVRARIVVPVTTPKKKIEGIERYHGEIILHGQNYDEAEAESRRIERDEDVLCISPYNDPHVIAGAGTIGLELLNQIPNLERVIIPVSGGGLIAGIAVALKSVNPFLEIVGVCAGHAPAMFNEYYGTVWPQEYSTLAEALSGEVERGSITIELTKKYVDKIVLVTEDQIASAMEWMVFQHGVVVEGGGAVGVAAAQFLFDLSDSRPTAILVTGSNIDKHVLMRVLTKEKKDEGCETTDLPGGGS
eukprot:TRINITY_DN4996_c0_g1_i4.p1 TRINITY_DN4996_c0_g1~~TRINITY_DN4996_c0_g1_i4.p1  ORF type:complete len:277 (-),score=65.13 TRINITY_DN4996_c0_g1_i4:23-853(-)